MSDVLRIQCTHTKANLAFLIVNHQAGSVTASHHVQTINLEPYNMHNIYNVQRLCFEV